MKSFNELTYLGQVRRLRQLAQAALERFGLKDAKLTFINHGENATFSVTVPQMLGEGADYGMYAPGRFLLRIHRTIYQSAESISSELMWLSALRQDGDAPVPEPVPAPDGSFLIEVSTPGIPDGRHCTLLRWIKGRHSKSFRLAHFRQVGTLTAQLHEHALYWQLPAGFTRRRWDWVGLFGDNAGFNLPASEVWALLEPPVRDLFQPVANRTRDVMAELDRQDSEWGLIHADLGGGNVLFASGRACAIDFDDCGFGYWVYDFASTLAHWQTSEQWSEIRAALFAGYTQVRPLPEQITYLDLFMAARHVSEILWAADMAQINPGMREGLPGWIDWAVENVRMYTQGCICSLRQLDS